VALAVRDDGIGIAAAQHAAVFEPFVQAHRDLSAAGQHGTGLGLAISRELTRGMGGELTLASEVGRGSTFTVVLRRVSTAEDVTAGA
jgi:signal transduction histidine kinase